MGAYQVVGLTGAHASSLVFLANAAGLSEALEPAGVGAGCEEGSVRHTRDWICDRVTDLMGWTGLPERPRWCM